MRLIGSQSLAPRLLAAVLAGSIASTSFIPLAGAQGAAAAAKPKPPSAKAKKEARAAYGAGEKAFDAGDFVAAEENFRKALELIPTPHARYWIAKSIDKQGKVKEAIDAYGAFLAEADHERAGEEKNKDANSRLEELKKTPGEFRLVSVPAGAAVSVDGQAQMGETPMDLKLAPGKHTIEIVANGFERKTIEVDIAPAGKSEESVELTEAAPAEPVAAPAPAPAPVEQVEEPAPEPPSKLPAYITLGIAGAGAIVGTIFGIKALSSKGDYDDNPTNDTADDVERNALIADMAFGVAITLGVTGIVLLTSGSSDPAADAKRLEKKRWANMRVSPYVSPKGGGAAAMFSF